MTIDQYGLHIGSLFIHFYGIILMSGVLAGAFLASREARRRGENEEIVWDALTWIVISGILGARLWHILTPSPSLVERGITTSYYLTHPLEAIAIWRGGLGIPGAVIGGALALYVYTRIQKINFARWLDIFAPSLALGQAIGRWGNFVNQELYGAPTNLPWAIYIEPQNRLLDYMTQSLYHPIFLYESLWSFASVALLLWIGRRYQDRLKAGDIFLTYLITYPIIRFLLEFIRLDSSRVAGLNANQTVVLVVGLVSLTGLIFRHRLLPKLVRS
ncbi:MAG: prolipoprotein diacylglyceryl transferase [Chloroflexi bacterium]|jgi:phosphatidylglycerol---prolipoprotein diacylglyceryl transferase|nr:prolipoprotein diacylglyceryl transferase [Chloroflexota bacterium]